MYGITLLNNNEVTTMSNTALKVISFKASETLRQQLAAMDNASAFIRTAIIEKISRERMTAKNGKQ